MPKTEVSSVFPMTPVTRAETPSRTDPLLARRTASATIPRIPNPAARMLATRWLIRNSVVGTKREQSRQHFVHGFLERVEGIDFSRRVEMGIRADRYKAMVPTVVGPLRLTGRVHATEARLARAHTSRKLKFTLPGPMTIVDTIADV